MVRPGIFECTYAELQPVLRQLLENHIDPDDPVMLCATKFWDGELSGFVITARKALLASWDTGMSSEGESKKVQAVRFAETPEIIESSYDTILLTHEHRIELRCADALAAQMLIFPFLHQDRLYHKFRSLLKDRIAAQQSVVP